MEISNERELITLFHDRISNIYYEKKLVPLRRFYSDGNDFSYTLPSGKQFMVWTFDIFNGIIPNKQIINNVDDLLFLLIKENPSISRKEISKNLNINSSAVQKHLEKMKKSGVLKREGAFGGKWIIINNNI
jgi:predicted HTH transcriptional regulator